MKMWDGFVWLSMELFMSRLDDYLFKMGLYKGQKKWVRVGTGWLVIVCEIIIVSFLFV